MLSAFVMAGIALISGVALAKVISCTLGTEECNGTNRADVLRCGPGRDDVYHTPGVDVVRGCEVSTPSG